MKIWTYIFTLFFCFIATAAPVRSLTDQEIKNILMELDAANHGPLLMFPETIQSLYLKAGKIAGHLDCRKDGLDQTLQCLWSQLGDQRNLSIPAEIVDALTKQLRNELVQLQSDLDQGRTADTTKQLFEPTASLDRFHSLLCQQQIDIRRLSTDANILSLSPAKKFLLSKYLEANVKAAADVLNFCVTKKAEYLTLAQLQN